MDSMRLRFAARKEVAIGFLAGLLVTVSLFGAQAEARRAEDLFKQGNEFSRLAKWKQAIEAYRKALDVRPAYPEAHYNLANAYAAEQQAGEAIQEYREVLRLKPDFPGVHLSLGALFEFQGQVNEAIEEYGTEIR